MREYLAAF